MQLIPIGKLRTKVNYQKPTTELDDLGAPLTTVVNGKRERVYSDFGSRLAHVETMKVEETVQITFPTGAQTIVVTQRYLAGLAYADRMYKNGFFDTDTQTYAKEYYEIVGIEDVEGRRIWQRITMIGLRK